VRSYPGEWAKLDGFWTTSLAADLTASQTSISLTDAAPIPDGSDLLVDFEVIKVFSKQGNSFTDCVRGASGGQAAAAHARGARVLLGGTVLEILGADAIYRDFEVLNSWPKRDSSEGNQDLPRGAGIAVRGPRNKVINTVVHDTVNGITSWSQAPDNEIYGNLIYNVGWLYAAGEGHGHGMYLENQSGYKLVSDNLILNTFNLGTQAFGVTGPFNGGRFEGNVYANAGALTGRGGNLRTINLLIGTQSQAIPSVEVIDNHFYFPDGVAGTSVKLGYGVPGNGLVTFTGNRVTGGGEHLDISDWLSATVRDNEFYSTGGRLALLQRPDGGSYDWGNNSYYDQTAVQNCVGGNRRASFGYNGQSGQCGGSLDYNEWRAASSLDGSSQYNQSAPVARVVVRANRYEAGRAHIIVYNWGSAATASVDVTGVLNVGDSYEVRNAQDYSGGVVAAGVYGGGSLTLPLTGLSVAAPLGYDYTAAPLGPKFNVFLLRRR
jgi:hypothetical protein